MELPLCAQCHAHPVKWRGKQYCSSACFQATRRKPVRRCRCGADISKQAIQCRACVDVTHRQNLAKHREKAIAVSRARYIERQRVRFSQPQKKSDIDRAAYLRGYQACWQSVHRQILRGDLIVVRERKLTKREAA